MNQSTLPTSSDEERKTQKVFVPLALASDAYLEKAKVRIA
jgi:hypothetical protein